jgi:hypothetical protein
VRTSERCINPAPSRVRGLPMSRSCAMMKLLSNMRMYHNRFISGGTHRKMSS